MKDEEISIFTFPSTPRPAGFMASSGTFLKVTILKLFLCHMAIILSITIFILCIVMNHDYISLVPLLNGQNVLCKLLCKQIPNFSLNRFFRS